MFNIKVMWNYSKILKELAKIHLAIMKLLCDRKFTFNRKEANIYNKKIKVYSQNWQDFVKN
jgi:hypothetical protein